MDEYEEIDYARSGFVMQETIVLSEGPMPEFSHSIEPHLRQLGMPTVLQKGVVTLIKEYTVCKAGQIYIYIYIHISINIRRIFQLTQKMNDSMERSPSS